jgi:hypothetical protein
MASERSKIFEQIQEGLLTDKGLWDVYVADQSGYRRQNEKPVEIPNPYGLDLSRFLPKQAITDLPRFFNLTSQLIDFRQELDGINENSRVKLVEDFNPEEFHLFGNEVITYKIISRQPGQMNRDASGRPQRKGLHSHDLQDPSLPNKVVVVNTRPTDNEIEFSCWSKTSTIASNRVLWLENLLITHDWVYQTQGVDRFWWVSRGADTFTSVSGQRLYQRPIRFKVRLTEFELQVYPILRQVTISLGEIF